MRSRRKLWTLILGLTLLLVLASGCVSGRVVLVSEGTPTRLGPDVKARIYVLIDGTWTLTDDAVALPEGWYLLPPSFVKPENFK